METNIGHLSVAPNTSDSLHNELMEALIGSAECSSEKDFLDTGSRGPYNFHIFVSDRLHDRSVPHQKVNASREIAFAANKKRQIVLHVDRRPCSSTLLETQFLLVQDDDGYRDLLRRTLTSQDISGQAMYIVLPAHLDTISHLKKKQIYDFLTDPSSIIDLFLKNMLFQTCRAFDSIDSSKYSSLALLKSKTLPGSSHVVDFIRYLLKPPSNHKAFKRQKKRKRDHIYDGHNSSEAGEQIDISDQNVEAQGASSQKALSNKKTIYKEMLCSIPGVTAAKADMIINVYPSMGKLLAAYDNETTDREGLLENVIGQKLKLKFGKSISKEVFTSLCGDHSNS